MRIIEVRGEFDRFFQPLDRALRVVVLSFLDSLFILLDGLFRDVGRQLPDIYNMNPAQSVWATGGPRASVQEDEYVGWPWDIDWIIHVFEPLQANTNVVGAMRDVAEFEIAV